MTNDERWSTFISELRDYIEEHHLCPPKHCTLYNEQKYYRRKLKEGKLDDEKAKGNFAVAIVTLVTRMEKNAILPIIVPGI